MTEFIHTQNSFAHGEIAPEFYLNKDIYGLSRLENMDVLSGGGLTRRAGLVDVAILPGLSRIFSYDISNTEHYILVFSNNTVSVYSNDTLLKIISSPWPESALTHLQCAGFSDSLVFVQPDYCPYVFKKSGNDFTLDKFNFYDTTGIYPRMPFMKYDDMYGINISVTAGIHGVQSAILTASANYWNPDNVGTTLRFNNQNWQITEYISPTVVYATSTIEYTLPAAPVTDWLESAFDDKHGWPIAITFHQDRLVFGGTRAIPGGIWMSHVGDYHNFDAGSGLDDEAISTTLLSKERQQVCSLISSDKLQVLTSAGEWAIANQPVTPSSMNIVQHTTVGSPTICNLPPQKIEGDTVFVSSTLRDIRKLSLDTLGERYNADDLCLFSKHMLNSPVDITYNKELKQLYLVNADGTMAVLNQNVGLGISAWSRYSSYAKFKSVVVIGNTTYVVLENMGTYKLAKFSGTALTDSGTHDIEFCASGLPLSFSGHRPKHLRLRKVNLRLVETKGAFINNMRLELPNEIYDASSSGFSGDISMNFLGSQIDVSISPWQINGNEPEPITVLSVTIYGQYEI